ncbi:MAG: GNAT family N-acetyltransferase [Anaerolineae bacterium]
MPVDFSVRPVTLADAAALQRACYPYNSLDAVRELLQRALGLSQRGRGLGVVAVRGMDHDQEVLGYGQLTLWPRAAEISDLIVTELERNQGIGSGIIYALLDKCRLWHLNKVEIGAALTNPRALSLYRRLHFMDDRIVDLDLGNGLEPVMYLTMRLYEV